MNHSWILCITIAMAHYRLEIEFVILVNKVQLQIQWFRLFTVSQVILFLSVQIVLICNTVYILLAIYWPQISIADNSVYLLAIVITYWQSYLLIDNYIICRYEIHDCIRDRLWHVLSLILTRYWYCIGHIRFSIVIWITLGSVPSLSTILTTKCQWYLTWINGT